MLVHPIQLFDRFWLVIVRLLSLGASVSMGALRFCFVSVVGCLRVIRFWLNCISNPNTSPNHKANPNSNPNPNLASLSQSTGAGTQWPVGY